MEVSPGMPGAMDGDCDFRGGGDNSGVLRRIHVARVLVGEIILDEREAHHVRDVLRLREQRAVEVFDDAGNVGAGVLGILVSGRVTVRVESISARDETGLKLVIAAAVPKGPRADWMVEKLSELGVDVFVPLATERSVSLPEGKNKPARWQRLAEEAAKQSHRRGVMRIDALTDLPDAITAASEEGTAWCLSTGGGTIPLVEKMGAMGRGTITLFIGPEGGWTAEETEMFERSGILGVSLTSTILRIETAAIAAAAVVAMRGGYWPIRLKKKAGTPHPNPPPGVPGGGERK